MNQQYRDILTIIERHGPITTGDICEKLTGLGYGGAMSWVYFRDSVAKQLGYLRDKGEVTGEDKPQPKGKPLRYWSLAESQPEEMASDVAEVDIPTVKDSLTVEEKSLVHIIDSLDTNREITEREITNAEDALFDAIDRLDALHDEIEDDDDDVSEPLFTHHPMTVQQALANKPQWMGGNEFTNFLLGIEAAEKHHGISQ